MKLQSTINRIFQNNINSVLTLNPIIMKSKFAILVFACLLSGKVMAQGDLIAENRVSNAYDFDRSGAQKMEISNILENVNDNSPVVRIESANESLIKVRVFTTGGDVALEDLYKLDNDVTELSLNFSKLSAGTYMVQFYNNNTSALRRYVKI